MPLNITTSQCICAVHFSIKSCPLHGENTCLKNKKIACVNIGILTPTLTISGHAHGETLLKATVLAPVSVHAHDETVFILYTHLVVDVLLNAASEETL